MTKTFQITKAQQIVFDLMEISSFNEFDGKRVVQDLKKNIGKWLGAIWGRFCYMTMLPLRDIPDNIYNADTLYLSVPKKYISLFLELAQDKWKADEVGYFCNGELVGTIDENLTGLKEKRGDFFWCPLGSDPLKDVAYFRIWWD